MTAKPQREIDFGRVYRVGDFARLQYRALNEIADTFDLCTLTGACGNIDRADLRRGLDRDGRRVAVEHAMALGALGGYDARRKVAASFANSLGFDIVDERPPISDKERAATAETVIDALGPIAQAAYRAALESKR